MIILTANQINNKQQTHNTQQTTNNQQHTNNKQTTTNNKQQTSNNNKQQTTDILIFQTAIMQSKTVNKFEGKVLQQSHAGNLFTKQTNKTTDHKI